MKGGGHKEFYVNSEPNETVIHEYIHVVISWKDGLWLSLDPQKGHNHTIKKQGA